MIDNHCSHKRQFNFSEYLFDSECSTYGITVNYADYSSIIIKTNRNQDPIYSNRLDYLLIQVFKFLERNYLKLNIDKTQILRTSCQQLAHNKREKSNYKHWMVMGTISYLQIVLEYWGLLFQRDKK